MTRSLALLTLAALAGCASSPQPAPEPPATVTIKVVDAPAQASRGQDMTIRLSISSDREAAGNLRLMLGSSIADIEPSAEATDRYVELAPGENPFVINTKAIFDGPQNATFAWMALPLPRLGDRNRLTGRSGDMDVRRDLPAPAFR
jgi:hypothetical protein